MKKTLIALVVISLFLITACAPQSPVYKAPPTKEPPQLPQTPYEPAPTMSFEEMYWNADCADIKNEFFFIQDSREYAGNQFVFRNREGNCMDNRFEQALYRGESMACSRSDSIAGVREYCENEEQRQMFSTIINNIDKPDFGLGQQYTVTKMTFELDGSEIPFEELSMPCVQRTTTNQVINTQQEYELLSANIDCLNLPPKIDFAKKTLLGKGVFGCSNDYGRQVLRNDQKMVYYYIIKQKIGFCEMADPWTQNWISVPKISQDYAVRFIVKYL